MLRPSFTRLLMVNAVCLVLGAAPLQGQEPDSVPTASSPAGLELLAEEATRAVVLIDVRTSTDSRQGSGFLVDTDGLILTNYHVIRGARSARVKLASGDVYEKVSILAEDARRDIAVLRVAGFDLPTLPLGNSDSVKIGQPIVMIGSPLGLENTVSTGIVSGRRQEPEGFQLLQMTAPASQGSSGGAVLTADGTAIGIAVSQLLAGQNLNFAVPINYARGLLSNLDREPIAVLQAPGTSEESPTRQVMSTEVVNGGLEFDLDGLTSLVLESTETLGEGRQTRTRITYRLIETVGSGSTRIERYLESETTRSTEPFGTEQTVRRERIRSLVRAPDLEPLESTGEIEWWSGQGWQSAEHEVRFEGDRVVGILTDSTGQTLDLDRSVPDGILLRDVRDLAFATLAADSLVGRSVELATFDPHTGSVTHDRYDVLAVDTIQALGEERETLRVNVASGLTNETAYFDIRRPRIVLRRVGQDGDRVTQTTRVVSTPPRGGGG